MKNYTKTMTKKQMVEAIMKKVSKANPVVLDGLKASLVNMTKKELNRWLNHVKVTQNGDISIHPK